LRHRAVYHGVQNQFDKPDEPAPGNLIDQVTFISSGFESAPEVSRKLNDPDAVTRNPVFSRKSADNCGMISLDELRERHAVVLARIAAAAARAGRGPDAVTLVAVSKTWPAELVIAAYRAGMRQFGENRPEELAAKRPVVEAALGVDSGIIWHLIGPVQSRKADLAATHADVFHALDRPKIARKLSDELARNGRQLPSFIEVNVSGEASKLGVDLREWEGNATQRAELRKLYHDATTLPGLPVLGLMTMAPWDAPPDDIRAVFRRTRELAAWLGEALGNAGGLALSMGMTDDYEIAIEEGATHVRVGRALFGERDGVL
jgi:pyridoxal phosphate enzyme (YggS family)